jgi:hypothetical protein
MSDTRHPENGPDPMTLGRETSAVGVHDFRSRLPSALGGIA